MASRTRNKIHNIVYTFLAIVSGYRRLDVCKHLSVCIHHLTISPKPIVQLHCLLQGLEPPMYISAIRSEVSCFFFALKGSIVWVYIENSNINLYHSAFCGSMLTTSAKPASAASGSVSTIPIKETKTNHTLFYSII